jgi:hypothetical protein
MVGPVPVKFNKDRLESNKNKTGKNLDAHKKKSNEKVMDGKDLSIGRKLSFTCNALTFLPICF